VCGVCYLIEKAEGSAVFCRLLGGGGARPGHSISRRADSLARLNDRLKRSAGTELLSALHLHGMFRYLADAANHRLAAPAPAYAWSKEARLHSVWRRPNHGALRLGAPRALLVNLEGLIAQRSLS